MYKIWIKLILSNIQDKDKGQLISKANGQAVDSPKK